MRLSAFTPLGLLRLSNETPTAERIYRSLNAGLGGQFSTETGSFFDATHFAMARGMARARRRIQQAAMQGIPRHMTDLLPLKELEKELIPGPNDTLKERRDAVAARTRLPATSTVSVVESELSELLGADFIAYRPTPIDEVSDIGDKDAVTMKRPDADRKIVRLLSSVTENGSITPWTIRYEVVAGDSSPLSPEPLKLVAGEVLVLEPHRLGRGESITIQSVSAAPDQFTAIVGKTHEEGAIGFTHPLPIDSTTKRHSLIVVTQSCALDQEKRRKINGLMRRLARSTSTWDIVAQDGVRVQQFRIGEPAIGISIVPDLEF